MIRTFFDHKKQSHSLDLDLVQVDGVQCVSVQTTEQYIQFETVQGTAITCELAQFWHEIAGPDLDAREAGLLLAECLMRQVLLQRMSAGLHEVMCLLTRTAALPAEIPSFNWITTRIDPFVRQAMSVYDGTPETTAMLTRILQCEPATIQVWARQLGLEVSPAPASRAIEATVPTDPVAEVTDAKHPFLWTPERRQQLDEALATCTGTTVVERARQIAYEYKWPIMAVRSKLYTMQPQRRVDKRAPREPESTDDAKEGDRHADQCEAAPV